MEGIKQFSRIDDTDGIAGSTAGFGGTTPVEAIPRLKEAGFSAVINLQFDFEPGADVDEKRAAAKEAGLNYLHMPMDPQATDQKFVADFLAAVRDPDNQPVYIHCASATRVGALWALVRVLGDGWEIEAAARETEDIAARPEEALAFVRHYLSVHRT